MDTPLTKDDCDKIVTALRKVFPYVNGYLSTLGGPKHTSVMLTVSFEPKSAWANGILQNSKYAIFDIEDKIKHFSGGAPLFIARKFKSVDVTIQKITEWGIKNGVVSPTPAPSPIEEAPVH